MTIKRGDRVRFENGHDILAGTVFGRHVDPSRPEMEETWTVFADSVLVKEQARDDAGNPLVTVGEPRKDREGKAVLDTKGQPKLGVPAPVLIEKWLRLVNEDGVQTIAHKDFAGEPMLLVKHGVPVPFRVRARRMSSP